MNMDQYQQSNYSSFAGNTILNKSNVFQIFWAPDYFCNYKCSYCWPGSNSPIRTHLPIEILISSMKILKSKINSLNVDYIHLNFAGGEPTLVPGFLDLVKEYANNKTKNQSLAITTNLSQGKKWWSKFLKSTSELNSISISASWHRESLNDIEKNREKFIDIYNMCKSHKRQFAITLVIPPAQFDDVYSDALYFRAAKIPTLVRVERKTFENQMLKHPDYTDDMIESINDWYETNSLATTFVHSDNAQIEHYQNVEQAISLGKTNYQGWLCNAGYRSIVIRPNGDIFRGHACRDKKIGNIKEEYELYSKPMVCITPRCGCSSDMNQLKIK